MRIRVWLDCLMPLSCCVCDLRPKSLFSYCPPTLSLTAPMIEGVGVDVVPLNRPVARVGVMVVPGPEPANAESSVAVVVFVGDGVDVEGVPVDVMVALGVEVGEVVTVG